MFAVLGFGTVLTFVTVFIPPAVAEEKGPFEFIGGEWYYSTTPHNVSLNEKGHLVWENPSSPQQWTVRLPEQDLSNVGDVAKVAFLYKAVAEGSIEGGFWYDIHDMAGTGDFRIGLFDSAGGEHVSSHNHDYNNSTWVGYKGYHARIFPHMSQGFERVVIDGEVHLPGNLMKRTRGDNPGVGQQLVAGSGSYSRLRYIDGFDLELEKFSPLIVKLERTAPETLVFSITLNEITYEYEDSNPAHQPQKIDAMGIYFPNHQRPYGKVVFAPIEE